uniref:Late embryogenesis abundant protein n=1 Tax=Gossypium hirsutum TaxID=3635 RepID=Q39793_GOSHI|nr:late embryogenesis abundant protein [Gossypium hirsutum]
MARSVSSFKFLGASVFDALYVSISRCTAAAVTASFGRPGAMGKVERRYAMKESSSSETRAYSSAWAPDPVTGYYRPENCGAEIDAADLREMMLNHRVRSQ